MKNCGLVFGCLLRCLSITKNELTVCVDMSFTEWVLVPQSLSTHLPTCRGDVTRRGVWTQGIHFETEIHLISHRTDQNGNSFTSLFTVDIWFIMLKRTLIWLNRINSSWRKAYWVIVWQHLFSGRSWNCYILCLIITVTVWILNNNYIFIDHWICQDVKLTKLN